MSHARDSYVRPLDLRLGRVDMNHGAGGRASAQLTAEVFLPAFDNPPLRRGDDGAVVPLPVGARLVMTTDSHVVSPLFFPGGDIGCLSVHGALNDVAVMGATPLYLTAAFILEEGLPLADLVRIARSMGRAACESGVTVVAGDTKVVERGKGDGVFITTTAVGALPPGREMGGAFARPGDEILVSGTMGDHGIAILSVRQSLEFETPTQSDTASLNGLIAGLLRSVPEGAVRVLRDPTRGGLATTLNEIAHQSGVGMMLDESAIPVSPQVSAACELLGLDPLQLANEGKVVVVVAAGHAQAALQSLRSHPLGTSAARIGSVQSDPYRFVQMRTRFGGLRVVDWLSGEPLPRIC